MPRPVARLPCNTVASCMWVSQAHSHLLMMRREEGERTYLNAAAGMLLGTEKERSIDKGIAIEDQQLLLTQNACNATHLRLGQ